MFAGHGSINSLVVSIICRGFAWRSRNAPDPFSVRLSIVFFDSDPLQRLNTPESMGLGVPAEVMVVTKFKGMGTLGRIFNQALPYTDGKQPGLASRTYLGIR